MYEEAYLLDRYEGNPILRPQDVPFPCRRVYNPGAWKVGDEYVLILRLEDEFDQQSIGLARSSNGYDFTVEPEPVLLPDKSEMGKLNDPRLTFIDGWFYLTYCSDPSWPNKPEHRNEGIFLCISRTRDFKTWEKIYKSEPDNRNAVIFPEKINGMYVRLDRPFKRGYRKEAGFDIWISYSPDMRFWGNHSLVLSHLDIPWGQHKIGPGAPPVKTDEGWLVLFHGAALATPGDKWKKWCCGNCKVYCGGMMLLDLENPSVVRALCHKPILVPTYDYEMDEVYRPNVVFPTGAIPEEDGTLKMYYGASDTTIALATARLDDMVDYCLSNANAKKLKASLI